MRNYYFFKSTTYRNEQGETRRCLRALPGQYMRYRDAGTPAVRTEYHVQCDAATLGTVCRLPLGTIFGCYEEGSTYNRSTLTTYHRNGKSFYRPTKIWTVCVPGDNGMMTGDASNDADERRLAICAAYTVFTGGENTPPERTAPAPAPAPAPAQAQAPAQAPAPSHAVESLSAIKGNVELVDSIRDAFRSSNPRGVKVSMVSRLLDLLTRGAARFVYMKQNGTQRSATGTRNAEMIRILTGDEAMSPDNQRDRALDGEHISYFDIEKSAWRCFCTRDLLATASSLTTTGDTGFSDLRNRLGSAATEI